MRPKISAYIKEIRVMLYDVDFHEDSIGLHYDYFIAQCPDINKLEMAKKLYKITDISHDESYIWFSRNQYELRNINIV